MTSKLRKTLRFQDFKLVEPHPTRDTRVTIKFKTMQRDYVFDFASPRDREVFMMKMKLSLPETVFAPTDVQVTDQLRPNSYTENRVSDLCVFQPFHSCSLMPFLFFVILFSSPLLSFALTNTCPSLSVSVGMRLISSSKTSLRCAAIFPPSFLLAHCRGSPTGSETQLENQKTSRTLTVAIPIPTRSWQIRKPMPRRA